MNLRENEKFIGIQQLLERLALVCFKNPSMTDTGTIYSNILLLYGVNDNDADDN